MNRHLRPFHSRTLKEQLHMDNETEPLSGKISRSCSEWLRTPKVAFAATMKVAAEDYRTQCRLQISTDIYRHPKLLMRLCVHAAAVPVSYAIGGSFKVTG
jgi:hypothetical protein